MTDRLLSALRAALFSALLAIGSASLVVTVTTGSASAQRADEDLYVLEEIEIDARQREVTIDLSGSVGAIRALRVRSPRDELRLDNIRVVYSDRQTYDERRAIRLLPGERTRPIDPQTQDRFVDAITLEIDDATPVKGRVRVQVIAHQSRDGRRARRPGGRVEPKPEVASAPSSPSQERPAASPPAAEPQRRDAGTVLDTAGPGGAGTGDAGTGEAGTGEVLFAAQRVALGLDADVIRVSAEIGRFRRVRLRVLENDVALKGLTVVYRDGRTQIVPLTGSVARNQSTAWFDVDPARFISELRVTYEADPSFRGRARIEAIGAFAENWLGPDGQGRRYNDGWVLLGAQTAGFVGFDDDTVPVGANTGGFSQVRFNVRDRAITLNEMQIVYADGTSQIVPIKTRVDAGSSFGPVGVTAANHGIREIKARYRSRFFDREASGKGAAIVEVWARY